VATVSRVTGVLQQMLLKDSGEMVKTDLHFVQYGSRPGKERSGAYLFLPDGDAKVCCCLNVETYTVNHKKRATLFLIITLALLARFLRASAMLKHVIDIGWTSVCLSVPLSVRHTLVLYQNG